MQLYFAEPYRFVPPYRGAFWCRLASPLVPAILRRHMCVTRWELRGADRLRDALRRGAGALLTCNHCRWPDPLVVAALGLRAGTFFHYAVAHHMFRRGRAFGWWLNRLGAFGINREGADREAVRAGAGILAEGRRPLVIFPEGTWYRQNDRLGDFREGLALIARHAARLSPRPLVVLPLALKYWHLEDPRPLLGGRLARLEFRLGAPPGGGLPVLKRVELLTDAFLARHEAEQLGAPRAGDIDARRLGLAEAIVSKVEAECGARPGGGPLLGRVLRLRPGLVRQLAEGGAAVRRRLGLLLLCEGLNGHSHAYLCERPSLERQAEAVQRLEEIVTGEQEESVGPLGAVVEVGDPLPVRELLGTERGRREEGRRLVEEVAGRTQRMLDGLLAGGPPPAWNCPPRAEGPSGEARPAPAEQLSPLAPASGERGRG